MGNQEAERSRPAPALLFIRHLEFLLMDPDGFKENREDQVRRKNRINDLAPSHIPHVRTQISH